jgi:hypothetical protein
MTEFEDLFGDDEEKEEETVDNSEKIQNKTLLKRLLEYVSD